VWALAGLLLLAVAGLPAAARAAGESAPLAPPDTASPSATLATLLDGVEAAYAARAAGGADAARVEEPLQRAIEALDLTAVPPEFRRVQGVETALLLYEILSRLDLPPEDSVPDIAAAAGKLTRWTIPDTPISLAQATQGAQAGEFLFEPRVTADARTWYERVRHLPKHPGRVQADVFQLYRLGTGPLLGRILPAGIDRWMPAAGQADLLGVPGWKCLAVLLANGLALGLVGLVWYLVRRMDGRLAAAFLGATLIALPLALRGLAVEELRVYGPLLEALQVIWTLILFAGAILLAVTLVAALGRLLDRLGRLENTPAARHAVMLGIRFLQIAVGIWLIVMMLQQLGVPVSGIVAGLGVGGIAVALAAQSTLGNLLGGVSLLADRPLRIGETCRFGSSIGTLEFIGLRSTRLRAPDRTLITVPNAVLANLQIENLGGRDRLLLNLVLGLRYETTPDQLRWVLARLRVLLLAHPMVDEDPARVRLKAFGASSLDVEIFAYVATRDWSEFLAVQEDVLLRTMDVLAQAGTGLAFPSQTLYVTRDGGIDAQRGTEAASEVGRWREQGNLPFPDFDPGERGELMNTLPWPPAGSALRRDQERGG
jgi:MscS family membrane protein